MPHIIMDGTVSPIIVCVLDDTVDPIARLKEYMQFLNDNGHDIDMESLTENKRSSTRTNRVLSARMTESDEWSYYFNVIEMPLNGEFDQSVEV